MTKNLVIVESPAKAKTIEKFLGKDFLVKSCYGHIRDLAKGDEAIDIKNNFKPHYEVPDEKKMQRLSGLHPMRTVKERPYHGIYLKCWALRMTTRNVLYFMKLQNRQF